MTPNCGNLFFRSLIEFGDKIRLKLGRKVFFWSSNRIRGQNPTQSWETTFFLFVFNRIRQQNTIQIA